MRKNKISKIALLTGLLMINTTTKGFYQCVPKQDWLIHFVRKHQGTEWVKVLDLQITSPLKDFKGYLEPGRYRLKAAAAGGKEEKRSFYLEQKAEFKACVGASGGYGMSGVYSGGGGGGGGKGYGGYYRGGNGGGISDKSGGCGGYGNRGCNGGNGNGAFYYPSHDGTGYGIGIGGKDGGSYGHSENGRGGTGCYGGGGGSSGLYYTAGSGGSGGSYFQVSDVELILKGGDGAGPDGYVIVERLE